MRVLMTTMKLDIGGAETHIIELSKALARRGIEVTVASNGGAYEAELIEAGIEHIKIPFHSKNPICMLRAYKQLKKLILNKSFDIVHAHARIPAFLCALLHKRYHFRFVTTAHWVFSTRFPYNLLTRWGDRSLAVSDDIKKYLTDNYGTNPDNVRVTINGIDLDKFSKDTDIGSVKEEFALADGKTRIVYVSRMDVDRSLAAHKLIAAAPDLYAENKNLEIVIVGGGNDYESIKAEAESVNKSLNNRLIVTTGSRTDINRFTALADIFIGVSRAALEAMACEKPSIIAGNEGYIGIFDEDKLGISIDTNFCCRGCSPTDTDTLKADVISLLRASNEERARLGAYSRSVVGKHYSIDTMADDAVKMYISVIKNSLINEVSMQEFEDIENYLAINPLRRRSFSSDIMISGYYGFGNSGDDSILYAIVKELKTIKPDIKIVTLSNTPKKTSEIYGVDSINRFNILSIALRMLKTKLLISGGGSLIQDVTSTKSLTYYLSVIRLAKLFGKKVMLYANGIGPINKPANYKPIKKVLNKVDLITLRESSSLEELNRFGITKPQIKVTADPAFNLFPSCTVETNALLQKAGLPENSRYCVVAIRDWKTAREDFVTQIANASAYANQKYGLKTVFVLMQPTRDAEISKKCASVIGDNVYVINRSLTPPQLLGIVNEADFVVGMRLHTLIYAIRCLTAIIGISYDPKIDAVMDFAGQCRRIPIEDIKADELCRYIDEVMSNKDSIVSELCNVSESSAVSAIHNAELAIELINK